MVRRRLTLNHGLRVAFTAGPRRKVRELRAVAARSQFVSMRSRASSESANGSLASRGSCALIAVGLSKSFIVALAFGWPSLQLGFEKRASVQHLAREDNVGRPRAVRRIARIDEFITDYEPALSAEDEVVEPAAVVDVPIAVKLVVTLKATVFGGIPL
jgi:hypothetical protein